MKKGLWGLCHVLLVMALAIMVNASAVEAAYHHSIDEMFRSGDSISKRHTGFDYLEGRQYRITNVYPQDGIEGRPQPYFWVLPEEVGSVVEVMWADSGLFDYSNSSGHTTYYPELQFALVSAPANTRFAQNLEWHQDPETWRSVGDVLIEDFIATDGYGNSGLYAKLNYIEVPKDLFMQAKPEDFVLTPVEFGIDKPMSEWTDEDLARMDAESFGRLNASSGDSADDSSLRTAIIDYPSPTGVKLVESGNTMTVYKKIGFGKDEKLRPIFTMERIK